MTSVHPKRFQAPELYGDFWFNSGPVSLRALLGSIILIDFWDYSNSACLRGLPYLKEWYKKYRDFGLMVVGVHTPEFKFGRNPEHLQRAIQLNGIEYPVVSDNEALIWNSFGNSERPGKYLIDKDGFVRGTHQGEGGYDQIERSLQSLLVEVGFKGELPELVEPLRNTDYPGVVCYRASREIHVGYLRGSIGNVEGYNPEFTLEYNDPLVHLPSRFYAHGKWFGDKEYLQFEGSQGEEGYITLGYQALAVNVVLNPLDARAAKVFVYQDDQPLSSENGGEDIEFTDDGRSCVLVDSPRLFNIVRNKEYREHRLKLVMSTRNIAVYTFSFETGVIPDYISKN